MFDALFDRIRARRPLWAVYPTQRLGVAVLIAGGLWLIPGVVGRGTASGVAMVLIAAAAFDYFRLPASRRLTVEREVPASIGLGDTSEFSYTLRSDWPWPTNVELWFNDVGTMPTYFQGIIEEGGVLINARNLRVELLPDVAPSCRYLVTWDA